VRVFGFQGMVLLKHGSGGIHGRIYSIKTSDRHQFFLNQNKPELLIRTKKTVFFIQKSFFQELKVFLCFNNSLLHQYCGEYQILAEF
jgi:hypothetical protein